MKKFTRLFKRSTKFIYTKLIDESDSETESKSEEPINEDEQLDLIFPD